MLFDDDDEFLETELCSAASLHYAWPRFLLLNSRNALVSSTETAEISIWGEAPLPASLTKGVLNPHPFFLWLLPNWPSEGLSQQASLGFPSVLRIPQQRYLPCFPQKQGANSCWAQWANSQSPNDGKQFITTPPKGKNKPDQGLQSLIDTKWASAPGTQTGFKLFWNVCIKNSDILNTRPEN